MFDFSDTDGTIFMILIVCFTIIFSDKFKLNSKLYIFFTCIGWLFVSIFVPYVFILLFAFEVGIENCIPVGSLIGGSGFSIIYYLINQDKFSSTQEKAGFFLAIIAFPPTLFSFLF